MIRSRKTIRYFFLVVLLSIQAGGAFAQATEEAESEKMSGKDMVKQLVNWVSVFASYSDIDLSDKADMGELNEAADLVYSYITNPELEAEVAAFKTATFINVYPKGKMGGEHWIFKELNKISDAQYTVLNSPYLSLEVWFTPIDNNTGYLPTIVLQASENIKENVKSVEQEMNAALSGKKFLNSRAAKETINGVLFAGLARLKGVVGQSYAPNVAIRFEDELYLNGHTIEIWQRADGLARLEAVDRNGNLLSGNLTWTGVRGSGNAVDFLVNESRTDYVTLKSEGDPVPLRVTVRVKEFAINVEDLLKELLLEVVGEKLQKAREDLQQIKSDSLQISIKINSVTSNLEARAQVVSSSARKSDMIGYEEMIQDQREATTAELTQIKQDPVVNDFIESHRKKFELLAQALLQLRIETFLTDLVRNETSISKYTNQIRDRSPELIADLITNLVRRPENRIAVKEIVVDFINTQINEVAVN